MGCLFVVLPCTISMHIFTNMPRMQFIPRNCKSVSSNLKSHHLIVELSLYQAVSINHDNPGENIKLVLPNRLVWHILLLTFSYWDGISMYVIIIISKDPDIVGTTPIYVHYKRWMTLGSWTFFCIPLYGPQINCVLYSAQPHHARLCGFIKCWQRIFRHVCIYVCLNICVCTCMSFCFLHIFAWVGAFRFQTFWGFG